MKQPARRISAYISILVSTTFTSCQTAPPQPTSNTQSINAPPSVSQGFQVQSTSSGVRKELFPSQQFVRSTGKSVVKTIQFQVTADDLSRKVILNLKNGPNSTRRASSVQINVNGAEVIGPNALNQNIEGTNAAVTNLRAGTNELQVQMNSDPGSTIELSLEGFTDPTTVPGAVHSDIDMVGMRQSPYRQGFVGLKFREGMQVRMIYDSKGKGSLVDLSGISLTPLNALLSGLKVKDLHRAFYYSPEDMNQTEVAAEQLLQTEVPNGNLFYVAEFDTNADVWNIVLQLRKLPFIESAYPEFTAKAQSHAGSSNAYDPISEPDLRAGEGAQKQNEALSLTRIMEQTRGDQKAAWHFTKGDPHIKVAVLDGILKHAGIHIPGVTVRTHVEFEGANVIPIANLKFTMKDPSIFRLDGNHATASTGTIAANGHNNLLVAGVAHGATTLAISQIGFEQTDPANSKIIINQAVPDCQGAKLVATAHPQNNIIRECAGGIADSIVLALELGADVIVLEQNALDKPEKDGGLPKFTVEQAFPEVRVAILRALTSRVPVIVPAGNGGNNDISKFAGKATFDTGSIIAGGLNSIDEPQHQGSRSGTRLAIGIGGIRFNFGKSIKSTIANGLLTEGGHATDVSGIAEKVNSALALGDDPLSSPGGIGQFGGTSVSAPVVGGVVALMRSVNENLSPLEIRKILRETRQDCLVNAPEQSSLYCVTDPVAGLVDAYEAVRIAGGFGGGGTPSPTPVPLSPGLVGAFYPNTMYNPLEDLPTFQELNRPFAAKVYGEINFSSTLSDNFDSGLSSYFAGRFKGILKAPQTGNYTFTVRNDDGVRVKIDGNTVLDVYRLDNGSTTSVPVNLSAGNHQIELEYFQAGSFHRFELLWTTPQVSTPVLIPSSNFFHSSQDELIRSGTGTRQVPFNGSSYAYQPGFNARFIQKGPGTVGWPSIIYPPRYPFTSRIYDVNYPVPSGSHRIPGSIYFPVNDSPFTEGDTFGIGQTDNYSVNFSGFVRSNQGGLHDFKVCHDDGIMFFIESTPLGNWQLLSSPNATAYRCDSFSVNMQAGNNHRYTLHYDEGAGGAVLELYWRRPGQNDFEVIPANALFH